MSYTMLLKQIKQGNIAPVYLLYGTESYFIEKIKQAIIDRLLPVIGDELMTYDLEITSIQEVIADAETIPFFNEQKLLIVHNPLFLLTTNKRVSVQHDIDSLRSYLKEPPHYTTIIFIAPYEKIDKRKSITKLFLEKSSVLHSEEVKQYDVLKWVEQISKEFNITITNDAKTILETEFVSNLSLLHNEIEKLAHFVGDGGEVTKEVVINLMSHSNDMSVLQLVDAVMERNLYRAVIIFKQLEKMNEEPIAMLALLAYQFRVMLQVKLLLEKGYREQQILKQVNVHPYVVKLAKQRGKYFSVERLEQIIARFAETDANMKQGLMDKQIAFELLLYDLIQN